MPAEGGGGARLTNRFAARCSGIWKYISRLLSLRTTGPPPSLPDCPAFRRGKSVTVSSPVAIVESRWRGAGRGSRAPVAAPGGWCSLAAPFKPGSSQPFAATVPCVEAMATIAAASNGALTPTPDGTSPGPCGGGENSGIDAPAAVSPLRANPASGVISLRSSRACAPASLCATSISLKRRVIFIVWTGLVEVLPIGGVDTPPQPGRAQPLSPATRAWGGPVQARVHVFGCALLRTWRARHAQAQRLRRDHEAPFRPRQRRARPLSTFEELQLLVKGYWPKSLLRISTADARKRGGGP